ncbi:hypothetical protein T484DRAFT_1932302 [Baffinella frigidus]|nr:hypothetical protein T484DRAFT_1932302 [Cryptophyta sp. CCMP2293]
MPLWVRFMQRCQQGSFEVSLPTPAGAESAVPLAVRGVTGQQPLMATKWTILSGRH